MLEAPDPLTLARRILAGEDIPLEELKAFIAKADTILKTERPIRALEKVEEKNIDFF